MTHCFVGLRAVLLHCFVDSYLGSGGYLHCFVGLRAVLLCCFVDSYLGSGGYLHCFVDLRAILLHCFVDNYLSSAGYLHCLQFCFIAFWTTTLALVDDYLGSGGQSPWLWWTITLALVDSLATISPSDLKTSPARVTRLTLDVECVCVCVRGGVCGCMWRVFVNCELLLYLFM